MAVRPLCGVPPSMVLENSYVVGLFPVTAFHVNVIVPSSPVTFKVVGSPRSNDLNLFNKDGCLFITIMTIFILESKTFLNNA